MKRTKNGRKKWPWILLVVLLVLAVTAFGMYRWQENNIEAIKNYTQYTQQELEVQLQENNQQVQDMLEAALETAREVDAQQTQSADTESQQVTAEQTTTPSAPAEQKPSYEQLLQAIVDKVYALRREYVDQLELLEKDGIAAYKAIPVEQRKGKYLVDFASTYISKASTLEKECDKKMDGLVAELEALQKQFGQSDELVQQVINTYAREKSLKKAWYMAELEKRGMV